MDPSGPIYTPVSTLPTSTSYMHMGPSFPSTPSLLSRHNSLSHLSLSRSQPSNTKAKPQSKSHVQLPTSNPKRRRRSARYNNVDEDDWLLRTASALTLSRLEEKGQSWLVARESSTSLTGVQGDFDEDLGPARSGRSTESFEKERSRYASAKSSFSGSEGQALKRGATTQNTNAAEEGKGKGTSAKEIAGPVFVNSEDEEEMRAAEEDEILEDAEVDVDEGEIKRMVMGRIGGWIGWGVGWMDFRGDGELEGDEEEIDELEKAEEIRKGMHVAEVKRRLDHERSVPVSREDALLGLPPPPSGRDGGLLNDVRWLFNVAFEGSQHD